MSNLRCIKYYRWICFAYLGCAVLVLLVLVQYLALSSAESFPESHMAPTLLSIEGEGDEGFNLGSLIGL